MDGIIARMLVVMITYLYGLIHIYESANRYVMYSLSSLGLLLRMKHKWNQCFPLRHWIVQVCFHCCMALECTWPMLSNPPSSTAIDSAIDSCTAIVTSLFTHLSSFFSITRNIERIWRCWCRYHEKLSRVYSCFYAVLWYERTIM